MFTLPPTLFIVSKWICFVLVVIVFANLLYFTCLSLFGLIKPKREYKLVADKKKFVFVVPAHNEEEVIEATIESLLNQNYRKDLYDIVVIADNCTDNTLDIIQSFTQENVVAFENTSLPDEPRGKPHAIAKYIATDHWKSYDYVAFIDADNIVESNYLREMNAQLIAHPEFTAVQGYLGMKNVSTSITATGYAAVYFITNRAVQYANYRLGWNAAIGGTGFVLDTMYLAERGWNPRSYTEDFELQVELSMAGKKSGWNHFAVVHDEKPNSFIASHNQRTRWAQGHWFVAITTTLKQITTLFKSKSLQEFLSKVETLFYSYSMVRPIAYLCILLFMLIDHRLANYLPHTFSLLIFWLSIECLNFLIIPMVYFLQEAAPYFDKKEGFIAKSLFYLRLTISFAWNSFTYMIAQVIGFFTWFKPQNNWKKTVHNATFDR
ncbi:glycosyltransferase family 2 protein [Enterococcus hulanensis]|uniref:glycosyltransferase family 2 protein n=1 Tax=Enterococcus hulanensis TaxID=2559929 RepID=UPI001A8FA1B9|nr:glycosyltransferase family 2 protein [Enterococcus hulanensis]MBO0458517.1 glycosyltransferase family 2 protein [Enterococcus hulanensis]